MGSFADAVREAGGTDAPRGAAARLRALLADELARGERELAQPRSGYGDPVAVAIARSDAGAGLVAFAPAPVALRSDPDVAPERAWLVVAALTGALVEATGLHAPARAEDLVVRAGDFEGHLALTLDGDGDPDLAALAFDEAVAHVDRLRAEAVALPAHAAQATGVRALIGAHHPLRVAEALARLGGDPVDPASADALEDGVLAILGGPPAGAGPRPHDDPDPARRVARRILQTLNGMGKWGGYHTEFSHLARGFRGNERALAYEVGEALLRAGLLSEKQSVGQRHVFLNPRRAGEIHRFIEDGTQPAALRLPAT